MTGGSSAPVYGEPDTSTLYSPAGPQSAFGSPQSAFGPPANAYYPGAPGAMDPNMSMSQANGMAQPGELSSLNYSQGLGNMGNMQLTGSPAGGSGFGANFQANPATWGHVKNLQMGVYTNDQQTVINGGSTFEFYVNNRFGMAGRILLGGANNRQANLSDQFHFTGDLYAGTTAVGEHWLKGGVLYDVQDNFSKVGPVFGALLFADHKHPISIDLAYGIGYGDPVINRVQSTILRVADDDTQLRAGAYLTPNLRVGFSGNWVNYADGRFRDYNTYGGFATLNLGTLNLKVDVTNGDGFTRGFVNVAYVFGGRRLRPRNNLGQVCVVEHPRDWLTAPVLRDVSLQLQKQTVANLPPLPTTTTTPPPTPAPTTMVGNVTQVNVRLAAGSGGVDGTIQGGETFSLSVQLFNGSSATANLIFTGNVTSTSNLGVVTGGTNFVTVGTLIPGQQTVVNLPSGGTISVPATAQPGDQFFIDFDVTADGQARRFRFPIIVGFTNTITGFSPATPIN